MGGGDRLRVAFWNVMNLFEPQTHLPPRGPQDDAELRAKVGRLAECIDRFFGGKGPDLLGLAEVHTERILSMLEVRLTDRYALMWEPAGVPGGTGLAVLARASLTKGLRKMAVHRPVNSPQARPRCVIVRCELKGIGEPILFVVNHWMSLYAKGTGAEVARRDREETAEWLGNWLSRSYETTCAIVVGDFNAEPTERPFSEVGLRSSRHFSAALWSQATPAYLYNTSWKFLTEPLAWEDSRLAGGLADDPRPKRTHDGSKKVVWDQLMVSGRAMKGGPIRLVEKSVDYHRDSLNSVCDQNGVCRPVRWLYDGLGKFHGVSDHFSVVAEFEVV